MKERKFAPVSVIDKGKKKMREKVKNLGIIAALFLANNVWPPIFYILIMPALFFILWRDVIRLYLEGYEYCPECRRNKRRTVMCERIAIPATDLSPDFKIRICRDCTPIYDQMVERAVLYHGPLKPFQIALLRSGSTDPERLRVAFSSRRLRHALDRVPIPK